MNDIIFFSRNHDMSKSDAEPHRGGVQLGYNDNSSLF